MRDPPFILKYCTDFADVVIEEWPALPGGTVAVRASSSRTDGAMARSEAMSARARLRSPNETEAADGPRSGWAPLLGLLLVLALFSLVATERATGMLGWWPGPDTDHVSPTQAESRAMQYAAALPLGLSPVAADDRPQALASMALTADAARALATELDRRATGDGPLPAVLPSPVPAAAPAPTPWPLVWVTLWDTDAEDGDVVRVDSGGYSRTVTLRHAPLTFALPAPADGRLRLTGVYDGGGGITVGASSGPQVLPLPLMSAGQTLTIPVRSR